jgi:hypothetical protein
MTAEASSVGDLSVVPFPGTPDASPKSQIIFLSLRMPAISSVSVRGSRSGWHSGHLVDLPDRGGTAFVPGRPFAPEEHVWVTARLRSGGGALAASGRRTTRLRFSFAVRSQVNLRSRAATQIAAGPPSSVQRFHSQPDLLPPVVRVTSDPDLRAGDIFLTATHSYDDGPLILDPDGRLLWFLSVNAANLEVQRYRGQSVLTWWQGTSLSNGVDVIADRTYRTVATVHAGNGYAADLHEFQITPQGTALIDAYARVPVDLTPVGGPRHGLVTDCVIQEVDIDTGQVLWEWHALGHIALTASYLGAPPKGEPYDFFHLNSIEQLPDGNLLISGRNTWSVYEISHRTGRVLWTLGGKHSSFRMGPGTRFEWQHDAHLTGHVLTVFDDAFDDDGLPQAEPQSSAKVLMLDQRAMTASLVHRYQHDPPLLADVAGSVQRLPNHNVFVGWGSEPEFSEFTPGGRQIFNGNFAVGVNTYRAYRFPWVGRPDTPPALVVCLSFSW